MQVKKGDNVLVIAGKDKGVEGKILTALPKDGRVIVDGVNIQKRHTKARSAQETGGIIKKPGSIDVSNVMVICPKCKKPTRIANVIDEKGKKHRACKHCQENLDKKAAAAKKKEKAEKVEKVEKAPKAAKAKAETAPKAE